VPGEARAMSSLTDHQGNQLVLVSQHGGKLLMFRRKKQDQSPVILDLDPLDFFLTVTLDDGQKVYSEHPYGAGYLSQSTRKISIPGNAVKVEAATVKGEKSKLWEREVPAPLPGQ
jgi:enediyne biosynthesis protein E4